MDENFQRMRFSLTPQAPSRARHWADGVMTLDPDVQATVILLLSELVANSVRHSGRPSADEVDVVRADQGDMRDGHHATTRITAWGAECPELFEVPVARDAGRQIGIARIALGHEQAYDVGGVILHGRDTSEIDEEIKTVALDAGQSLARGQADHEFVQYTRQRQPPTRGLILPGTRVH